jgi:hypothetical protein
VRTIIFTGRPLRVRSNEYIKNWEENRQAEIKTLTDKGTIPVEHDFETMGDDMSDEMMDNARPVSQSTCSRNMELILYSSSWARPQLWSTTRRAPRKLWMNLSTRLLSTYSWEAIRLSRRASYSHFLIAHASHIGSQLKFEHRKHVCSPWDPMITCYLISSTCKIQPHDNAIQNDMQQHDVVVSMYSSRG